MKKVLIPFDFNEVSLNALKYAFQSFPTDTEFVILHVLDGNLDLNDPLTYTAGFTRADALVLEMNKVVDELLEDIGHTVSYTSILEIGSIVDSIILHTEKESYDAILMGTRDKYDLLDKWFGTVSLGVVKRAEVPVYLIPKSATYNEYLKVLVAADKHLESDAVLNLLLAWNSKYKADMHFLHVLVGDDYESYAINIVEEFFEKRDLDFSFSIIQKPSGDISDTIIEYADEKNMDLQIVVSDNMSWFETITSKGVSQKMILKATRPMLFVHSGQRKKSQIFYQMASVQF